LRARVNAKKAQTTSRESLAAFRAEAVVAVDVAKAAEENTKARHAEVVGALERTSEQLRASDAAAGQLREELAASSATNAALERGLADARTDLAAEQRRADQERREHAAQREKTGERARLAEERFADRERRALLEIDRERTAATKLQKSLDSEPAAYAAAADRLRADFKDAQSAIAQLHERLGATQNSGEQSAASTG
jgi:hypothetical protein